MSPIVLIIRPEEAAQELAEILRKRWAPPPEIVISPILKLEYLNADVPLDGTRALIFTSRNGVEAFTRLSHRRDLPCYVVGYATQAQAKRHGLSATFAGSDGEELCAYLAATDDQGPFLHLHGEHVALDIAGRLRTHGRIADEKVLYRQVQMAFTGAADVALAGERPVIVPFFSPRSAKLFFQAHQGSAPLLCVAMSPNVAKQVPQGSVRRLSIAEKPDMNAMLDSLDHLRKDAIELEGINRAQ